MRWAWVVEWVAVVGVVCGWMFLAAAGGTPPLLHQYTGCGEFCPPGSVHKTANTPDSDSTNTDNAHSDTADTNTPDSDTADTDTADYDTDTETANSDTTDTDTTDSDTANTNTANSDSADTNTPDSDTADTNITDSDTAYSDATDTDTTHSHTAGSVGRDDAGSNTAIPNANESDTNESDTAEMNTAYAISAADSISTNSISAKSGSLYSTITLKDNSRALIRTRRFITNTGIGISALAILSFGFFLKYFIYFTVSEYKKESRRRRSLKEDLFDVLGFLACLRLEAEDLKWETMERRLPRCLGSKEQEKGKKKKRKKRLYGNK